MFRVGVFFQNDNINTLDEDSELRLSIMSSIAQDELRKLSSRVKFSLTQAIKGGVALDNNRLFVPSRRTVPCGWKSRFSPVKPAKSIWKS